MGHPELSAFFVAKAREQRGDGLLGAEQFGIDGVVGEAAVDGLAGEKALFGGGRIDQVGPGFPWSGGTGVVRLQNASVEERGEGCIEEDGGGSRGLLEQEAIGEDLGCASAQREDDIVSAKRGGEGLRLKLAEVLLAVRGEDGRDWLAGAGLDVGVEIEELPAEPGWRAGGPQWSCRRP